MTFRSTPVVSDAKERRHTRQHELRVAVAERVMARPGEYRRLGCTCTSVGTETTQSNVSGWWSRGVEVLVGHCAETHVGSKVSLLTRP